MSKDNTPSHTLAQTHTHMSPTAVSLPNCHHSTASLQLISFTYCVQGQLQGPPVSGLVLSFLKQQPDPVSFSSCDWLYSPQVETTLPLILFLRWPKPGLCLRQTLPAGRLCGSAPCSQQTHDLYIFGSDSVLHIHSHTLMHVYTHTCALTTKMYT